MGDGGAFCVLSLLVTISGFSAAQIPANEVNCGISTTPTSKSSSRVINGTASNEGQWPWQAALVQNRQIICGGTLIDEHWVLTAAHCFSGEHSSAFQVVLGLTDTRLENAQGVKWHSLATYICHPNYGGEERYFISDICLLKLAENATYTNYVRPACLLDHQQVNVGEECVVSGWGDTKNTGDKKVLQYATVEVIEQQRCSDWYDEDGEAIPDDHFCAGYEAGGVDTCQGDSGGPLVCAVPAFEFSNDSITTGKRFVLFGITSFGIGCALPERPGVYTNVTQYLDWIESNKAAEEIPTTATATKPTTTKRPTLNGGINPISQDNCGTVTVSSRSNLPRIVNGTASTSGQWPWQAMVLLKQNDGTTAFVCGGTLLRNRWVVTAAHCFSGETPSQTAVLLGANALDQASETSRQFFDIESITCHPDYGGIENNFINDICLMHLDGTATYTDYVRPACLPSNDSDIVVGDVCVISGWGETQGTGDSNILQYAQVGIISQTNCRTWYAEAGISVPSDHFCAGYEQGGTDSCQGDSGGPLTCPVTVSGGTQYVLRGITSFGSGCAEAERPGVYLNVVRYLDWIEPIVLSGSMPAISVPFSKTLNICTAVFAMLAVRQ